MNRTSESLSMINYRTKLKDMFIISAVMTSEKVLYRRPVVSHDCMAVILEDFT